jgi:hypothetical protein
MASGMHIISAVMQIKVISRFVIVFGLSQINLRNIGCNFSGNYFNILQPSYFRQLLQTPVF